MIGSSCYIYKTCKECGQIKWYKEFELKCKGKRRGYCKGCWKQRERNPFTKLSFNTGDLKNSDIKVCIRITSKRRKYYKISYEQAILMIQDGVAGIKNKSFICSVYDWKTFRNMILIRDKNVCAYCGDHGNTIDHIVPKSRGGLSLFSNCVCCCKRCNSEKGNRLLLEFFKDIGRFDKEIGNELLKSIIGRT